jgi:hypothetical protein
VGSVTVSPIASDNAQSDLSLLPSRLPSPHDAHMADTSGPMMRNNDLSEGGVASLSQANRRSSAALVL